MPCDRPANSARRVMEISRRYRSSLRIRTTSEERAGEEVFDDGLGSVGEFDDGGAVLEAGLARTGGRPGADIGDARHRPERKGGTRLDQARRGGQMSLVENRRSRFTYCETLSRWQAHCGAANRSGVPRPRPFWLAIQLTILVLNREVPKIRISRPRINRRIVPGSGTVTDKLSIAKPEVGIKSTSVTPI